MLRSYLKIAYRNIVNNKTTSLINILGLSIGFCFLIVTFLYVSDELKYDDFLSEKNIYRLHGNAYGGERGGLQLPAKLATVLSEGIPEVKQATFIEGLDESMIIGENKYLDMVYYTDSNFFSFFDLPLVIGSKAEVLRNPKSIVISETKAKEWFGTSNPIGRVVEVRNSVDAVITGVFKNVPKHFHIEPHVVASKYIRAAYNSNFLTSNYYSTSHIYFQLTDNTQVLKVEKGVSKAWRDLLEIIEFEPDNEVAFRLQPIEDVYLKSTHLLETKWQKTGNYVVVRSFMLFACLILLIACLNTVNISIASYSDRLMEIGVRKAIGSTRPQLYMLVITESVALVLMSFAFCLPFAFFGLKALGNIAGKQIAFSFLQYPGLVFVILGMMVFAIVLVALVPCLKISKLQPVQAISKLAGFKSLPGKSLLGGNINSKYVMLCFQFVISIALIVCTLVLGKQIKYIYEADLGFSRHNVVLLKNSNKDGKQVERFELLREALSKYPEIEMVSSGNYAPSYGVMRSIRTRYGNSDDAKSLTAEYVSADTAYSELFNFRFLPGMRAKNIGPNDILINETYYKHLGEPDIVGKYLSGFRGDNGDKRVAGVIKDVHYWDLYRDVEPLIVEFFGRSYAKKIIVKYSAIKTKKSLDIIEKEWNRIAPTWSMHAVVLDDHFDLTYKYDMVADKLIGIFTLLALFLCSIGLAGLSLLTSQTRTKEIGIRKVNGAGIVDIFRLLVKDFVVWIIIAFVIAIPLTHIILSSWLERFSYKVSVGSSVFILTGIFTLLFTLSIIIIQSWKIVQQNPVESLRYE